MAKLLRIIYCTDCLYYNGERCLYPKTENRIPDDPHGYIPDWCALEDANSSKTTKKSYKIAINGSVDTIIVEMDLSKRELETILELSKLSHKNNKYDCMPTITVEGYEPKATGIVWK